MNYEAVYEVHVIKKEFHFQKHCYKNKRVQNLKNILKHISD